MFPFVENSLSERLKLSERWAYGYIRVLRDDGFPQIINHREGKGWKGSSATNNPETQTFPNSRYLLFHRQTVHYQLVNVGVKTRVYHVFSLAILSRNTTYS